MLFHDWINELRRLAFSALAVAIVALFTKEVAAACLSVLFAYLCALLSRDSHSRVWV